MKNAKKALGAFLVVTVVAAMSLIAGSRYRSVAEAAGTTPSTTSLASGANPNVYGQSVTFTATVTGASGTPTGTVTFFNGTTAASTKTLASGSATWATTFSVGSASITATFNGNTTYALSTSPAVAQVTNKTPTTTTLTPSANPAALGAPVTLTAFVAAAFPGNGSPSSGTMKFFDGVVLIGSATPSSGSAAITLANLSVGAHPISATFGGSASYNPSTSPGLAFTVGAAPTATALAATPNPAQVGSTVTLMATVTSALGTPSGAVSFLDGRAIIGTATLAGGQATIATSSLVTGDHSITAAYAGNATFATSTSVSTIVTVAFGPAVTSTQLTATPKPSTLGAPVTFTATVASASGTPTGTVTFADGATVLGIGTVTGGQASISTAGLAVGDHVVTASYSGDTAFGSSSSAALTQAVSAAPTATDLVATPNPALLGTTVTFTATVSAGIGTPTGVVTFSDGVTLLGTGTLANGQAALATSVLTLGSHPVTVSYSGDAVFAPSASASVTATSLTVSPAATTYGGSVTFSATVTSGSGTPSGTVTFRDGVAVIGTTGLVIDQASFTTNALTAGSHTVTATYDGSVAFGSSTSGSVTESVTAANTVTTVLGAPNPSSFGSPITFTASVTSPGGIPAGTVTFLDGPTIVGTAPLSNGQATLGLSSLATGSHSITATYGTTVDFTTSTSAAISQTVIATATATTLSATPNPASTGSAVTITALVTSLGGIPTGAVTFLDGATAIGSAPLNAGQAELVTSTLVTGTHSLTASYAATTNFTASSSPAVAETISVSSALSVDSGNANCRDTGVGAGSGATPFCTIGTAASIATAGVTVVVASGTYAGNVSVKNSGTSVAPITFTTAPGASVTVAGGTNGFVTSSKSWIVIRGFNVTQTTGAGITMSSGSNLWVDGNHVSVAGLALSGKTAVGIKFSGVTQSVISNNTTDHNSDAGIYVTGSNTNTIRNNTSFSNARGYVRAAAGIDVRSGLGNQVYSNISHDNEDSGINAWTGTGTGSNFFSDNVTYANGDHGIDVHNGLNNRVIANTVYANYDSGIEMTTSTGTVLANNVSVDNGIGSARTAGNVRVDSASVSTTTLNDDLVFLRVAGDVIDWNGAKYASLAAFRTATGQESRGIEADPRFASVASANFHLLAGSPAIDSANSGASNQPAVDFAGNDRFDDAATVNTGLGPITFADRGAFEYS